MNEFDQWNNLKKNLEKKPIKIYPQERDVWICTIGRNVGAEQNGGPEQFTRHVLVLKKFNNEMFWGIPLSTKQKSLDFYFNFTDPENNEIAAIIAQLRLFSTKRFARKIYKLDKGHFTAIQRLVALNVGIYKNETLR